MKGPCLLLVLFAATGCLEFGEPRDDVPGELLGDYAVAGRLVANSCGEGALGSPERWDFAVRLSRQGEELFWGNGREFIRGSLERGSGRFAFATELSVELEPARAPHAGCTVVRRDAIAGELTGLGAESGGFEGDLTYGFAAADGADCAAFVGSPGGVAALPCQLQYALAAERVDPAATD